MVSCKGTVDEVREAYYCLGFLNGSLEVWALEVGDAKKETPSAGLAAMKKTTCLPTEGLTTIQLGLVLKKYMDTHPEKLDLPPGAVAVLAFSSAFPCRQPK